MREAAAGGDQGLHRAAQRFGAPELGVALHLVEGLRRQRDRPRLAPGSCSRNPIPGDMFQVNGTRRVFAHSQFSHHGTFCVSQLRIR